MSKICNFCHENNNETANFCIECGNNIENKTKLPIGVLASAIDELGIITKPKIIGPAPMIVKPILTYTCWIGNISTDYSIETLEKHFRESTAAFGEINSIKIKSPGKGHNVNQCFINFLDKESAEQAVKCLNGADFNGLKLIANVRDNTSNEKFIPIPHKSRQFENWARNHRGHSLGPNKSESNKSNTQQSTRVRNSSLSKNSGINNNSSDNSDEDDTILPCDVEKSLVKINNSKYLKYQLEQKVQKLKDKYPNSKIEIHLVNNNYTCKVTCNDENINDEILTEIKRLKSFRRCLKFKKNEMTFLNDSKKIIIKECCNHEAFININEKKSELAVYSFDKSISNSVCEKVKKFVEDRIELKEEKEIVDSLHYELLKNAFRSRDFLKRNGLEKFKFEFKDPIVEKNENLCGKIITSGKKSQFTRINICKFFEVYNTKEDFSLHEKSSIQFIKYKLKTIKSDFKGKFLILKYSETNLQKKDCFELYGLDQLEVNKQTEEIKYFLENARFNFIDLRTFDILKVKKLLEEYQKNDSLIYEETAKNHNIYLDEKSKKLFINGTDEEEINQIKESITKLINGSREINKTIEVKNLIYKKLVEQSSRVFSTLRQNYRNLKIFYNLKNGQNIRVCGKHEEVEKVVFEIEQLFNNVSNSIILKDLEFKESEFKFLMKQTDRIEKFSSETNSIININGFKKYVSLKFSQFPIEIDLLEGDLTSLTNLDAYVNPANASLNHNDGIAKALVDKAGLTVKRECDQHIKKTGFLSEGDVYTTKSGEMGVKINSIIIHAVGPVWKGGLSSEAKTLSGLVKKCLIESSKNNCNSIVIPPISTGLFNYPVEDAVEVISKTVLEYVYENPSTTLSKIIFISNEETVVKSWELVLLYIENIYNIKIEKRAQKVQISNDRWLWKDDEGKWLFLINNIKFNKLILRKLESICI